MAKKVKRHEPKPKRKADEDDLPVVDVNHDEPAAKVSDDALFSAMCDDAKPLAKKMFAPGTPPPAPPASYEPRGKTVGSLTWDSMFPVVMKLLAAMRLPFIVPSLVKLRDRINLAKWPAFLKAPIIAAIDVLIGDPELFKAHASPYADVEAEMKAFEAKKADEDAKE